MENMDYDPQKDSFVCAQGRRLPLRREKTKLYQGQLVTTAWYRCEDCSSCLQREPCCKFKNMDKAKEIKLLRFGPTSRS